MMRTACAPRAALRSDGLNHMKNVLLLRSLAAVSAAIVVSFIAASPAFAQWTPVSEVPTTRIFSVWANGDTLTATADSVVYISTDGGAAWKGSATVAPGVKPVLAARVYHGRVYAGTFGNGVFVSDNLGDTWLGFNQGLVGGFEDSQLDIVDLVVSDNQLHAATAGDGPWRRDLAAGSWNHFGSVFEPNQASNMSSISVGGTRLVAGAGANGMVFYRDPGDADWTVSLLKNVALSPGTGAFTAIWTGSAWVVGTNKGLFHSAQGQSPWTFVDAGLGPIDNVSFAIRPPDVFASFVTAAFDAIEFSHDNGASWQILEILPPTFIYGLATHDNTLYAARDDGLWQRSIATVAVRPVTWGSVKALYRKPGN